MGRDRGDIVQYGGTKTLMDYPSRPHPSNLRLSDVILEDCPKAPTGRHHFLLPPGGGPTMEGVCKYCDAKRLHNNYGNNVHDQINKGMPRKRKPNGALK